MERLLLLSEVAPLIPMAIKSAQHAVKAGRFPIRHVMVGRQYRFVPRDVMAFVERGEVTNELLKDRTRRYFGRAKRKGAAA